MRTRTQRRADWCDDIAIGIIATVHLKSFDEAMAEIADRLRALREQWRNQNGDKTEGGTETG